MKLTKETSPYPPFREAATKLGVAPWGMFSNKYKLTRTFKCYCKFERYKELVKVFEDVQRKLGMPVNVKVLDGWHSNKSVIAVIPIDFVRKTSPTLRAIPKVVPKPPKAALSPAQYLWKVTTAATQHNLYGVKLYIVATNAAEANAAALLQIQKLPGQNSTVVSSITRELDGCPVFVG